MEDFRDRWLFLATTAISWLVVPEVLYREPLALAEEAGGWDEHHTRSDLSQVLKRARRAARGETIEFMGREWDPRHHFRNDTIFDWLGITPEEEREMVITISAEEASRRKRLRDREYQEKRRRAKGVATHTEHVENRSSSLRKNIAAARQLKRCEVSTEEIAKEQGCLTAHRAEMAVMKQYAVPASRPCGLTCSAEKPVSKGLRPRATRSVALE